MRFFLIITIFIFFSCNKNKEKSYFINKNIPNEIETFLTKAKQYSLSRFEEKDTLLLTFSKKEDYFTVHFDYVKPFDYTDLFTVIKTKKYTCFVYSKIDLGKFIYTNQPFKIDTSFYKINYNEYKSNWYSDVLILKNGIFKRE